MSPFHARTAEPISTKFCTDLCTNSGKVLNTIMTPPTRPLDPGVPQTPKPKQVTGEKTLCNVKCPDGWRKLIKNFPGSTGVRLVSHLYIKTRKPSYQSPPNFVHTFTPTQGRFLTQLPNPGVPQTLKPKQITGEKLWFTKKCPDGWLNLIKICPGQCRALVG